MGKRRSSSEESEAEVALFDVYKVAVDECRFNIRLGWDRSQYFLTMNVAIVVAGASLVKVGPADTWLPLAALVFFVGFLTTLLAAKAISKSHEYYQRSRDRMISLEGSLGWRAKSSEDSTVDNPRASATTEAMRNPTAHRTGSNRNRVLGNVRYGTVTFYTIALLLLLGSMNLAASVVLLVLAFDS